MTGNGLVAIEGAVERIQYHNETNGFSVVWLDEKEQGAIVMVGTLHGIREGDMISATGRWITHPQYGEQFQVHSCVPLLPATLKGIERYLASGVIKGIGPKTAARLVERFGLDTLDIIEKMPLRLAELNGIGPARAEAIGKSFASQQGIRTLMLFLENYAISPAYAARIYKFYGEAALPIIRDNPYRLADEMVGIGFKTADKIASQMGIDQSSPHRLASGFLYMLREQSFAGHVFLPRKEAVARAAEVLGTSSDGLEDIITLLAAGKQIILDEDRVYLPMHMWAEQNIAKRLTDLSGSVQNSNWTLPQELRGSLSERQCDATELAMREGVLVITGGPGTGKTTTLRTILKIMENANLHVQLAAPTGRAAKRITEATGREAKTLHRLLEYNYAEGALQFQRNQERPLELDVLIVDEVSMVDNLLMHHLLQAIPPGARLLLVGDADQLPSVGPGSVLRDIVASKVIPCIHLDEIFRQDQTSMIILNAHRINQGEMPVFNKTGTDFFLVEEKEPAKIASAVVDLCTRRLPGFTTCNPVEDIQVLAPMKRSTAGVEQLNRELQRAYNPPAADKPEITHREIVLRLGDKVMQVKNNYDKAVFNGDMGIINEIDLEDGILWVRFPDSEGDVTIPYEGSELEELTLAYAISVHKSQGSEFPIVVMVITQQHNIMLQRNLLYTGITRARSLVVLVGTQAAVHKAVLNNRVSNRYTYLSERLKAVSEERTSVSEKSLL